MKDIVYSTRMSSKIIDSYLYYRECVSKKDGTNKTIIAANAAYINFANACEKENKAPIDVSIQLSKL